MRPQRSTKYRKHRESKYQYPTHVTKSGIKGAHIFGENTAKAVVVRRLKRPLHPDTIVQHTSGQWVFCEPRAAV